MKREIAWELLTEFNKEPFHLRHAVTVEGVMKYFANELGNEGYCLGFRTFVLQSGEDTFYTDSMICEIISDIKEHFPDCAVTLSIGEKSRESYQA